MNKPGGHRREIPQMQKEKKGTYTYMYGKVEQKNRLESQLLAKKEY